MSGWATSTIRSTSNSKMFSNLSSTRDGATLQSIKTCFVRFHTNAISNSGWPCNNLYRYWPNSIDKFVVGENKFLKKQKMFCNERYLICRSRQCRCEFWSCRNVQTPAVWIRFFTPLQGHSQCRGKYKIHSVSKSPLAVKVPTLAAYQV